MKYTTAFKKAIGFTMKNFKGVDISKIERFESGGVNGKEWIVISVEFSLYNPIIQSGIYYRYELEVTKEKVTIKNEPKEC